MITVEHKLYYLDYRRPFLINTLSNIIIDFNELSVLNLHLLETCMTKQFFIQQQVFVKLATNNFTLPNIYKILNYQDDEFVKLYFNVK